MDDGVSVDERCGHDWSAELTDAHAWGLRFTEARSIETICDALLDGYRGAAGRLPLLLTPNVDILVTLDLHPEYRPVVERAAFVLADGQPLVTLSAFCRGDSLSARLTGADLTERLWADTRSSGVPVLCIAPSPDVTSRLRAQHSDASVVLAPSLPAERDALEAAARQFAALVVEEVRRSRVVPRFVFSGIGFPKDAVLGEALIAAWPEELGSAPVVLGVGGSLSFVSGTKRRAPRWMRANGLEFAHRMAMEPNRLLRRYLIRDARFVLLAARQLRVRT